MVVLPLIFLGTAHAGDVDAVLAAAGPWRAARIAGLIPAIPESAYSQAAAGGVATGLAEVAGSPVKVGWGVGIVDVPLERYWAALNDEGSKARYTQLDHVQILDGMPCSARRVVFQYLGVTMLADRWWVVEQRANARLAELSGGEAREMRWASADHPLPDTLTAMAEDAVRVVMTEGGWLLLRVDDQRTLVEYHAASDPGGSVPAGLAASFAASGIKGTIAAIARLANDGAGCTAGP